MPAPDRRRRVVTAPLRLLTLLALLALSAAPRAGLAGEPVPAAAEEISAAEVPAIPVGEVQATATRAERGVLETPGHVTVIDREEIEESGLRDVAALLRRHAGVYVTNATTTPEGFGVEIRGFNDGGGGGSSTLVLVDGRRVNEPDSSSVDWAHLRLEDVERIEIVRGPASAVWGDNAVGGVIQIFTRRGEGGTEATLRGRAGSFETFGGSFYAGGREGRVTGSLYGDGFDSNSYRSRADFWSGRAGGDVRVDLDHGLAFGVGGGYVSDFRERPGALSELQIETLGPRAADPATEGDELDRERFHVDGLAEWSPHDALLFTVRPYYQERHDEGQISVPSTFPAPTTLVFLNDTDTETLGINPQGQIDLPVFGRPNRLVFGADILREEIDVRDTSLDTSTGMPAFPPSRSKSRRRIYAGYVQDELQILDCLFLSGGLRFDAAEIRGKDVIGGSEFELDRNFWSPKGAVVWRPLDWASAYFSYARGFRLPNIDEAFGFFGFSPQLDPERSHSYEVGFKVRRERAHFDLAFYRLDVTDEILFNHEIEGPFFPSPRSVNIDRVRHQGVELSARVFPAEWLEFHARYTYEDNEVREDDFDAVPGETRRSLEGERLPLTPEHRGSFGVILSLPFWLELGLEGRVVGSRSVANDLLNELEELDPFAVFDLRAAFQPRIGEHVELSFEFGVQNLYDEEYTEFAGERTFSRGAVGFFRSPGRNYVGIVGITVRR